MHFVAGGRTPMRHRPCNDLAIPGKIRIQRHRISRSRHVGDENRRRAADCGSRRRLIFDRLASFGGPLE